MEVSTADLATVLGVTERRVQQLATTGVLDRLAHGTWNLPHSVQAFIGYRLNGAITRAKAKSGSTEEQIKQVKLHREQLKLAVEERELIPAADALEAMARVCGTVVFALNTVAPGLTPRCRAQGQAPGRHR